MKRHLNEIDISNHKMINLVVGADSESRRISVYDQLLRNFSPTFKRLVESMGPDEFDLKIPQVSKNIMTLILDYVHQTFGEKEATIRITQENIMELLKAASEFELNDVKSLCHGFLDNLTFAQLVSIIDEARVEQKCSEEILCEAAKVWVKNCRCETSPNIKMLLKKFPSQDDQQVIVRSLNENPDLDLQNLAVDLLVELSQANPNTNVATSFEEVQTDPNPSGSVQPEDINSLMDTLTLDGLGQAANAPNSGKRSSSLDPSSQEGPSKKLKVDRRASPQGSSSNTLTSSQSAANNNGDNVSGGPNDEAQESSFTSINNDNAVASRRKRRLSSASNLCLDNSPSSQSLDTENSSSSAIELSIDCAEIGQGASCLGSGTPDIGDHCTTYLFAHPDQTSEKSQLHSINLINFQETKVGEPFSRRLAKYKLSSIMFYDSKIFGLGSVNTSPKSVTRTIFFLNFATGTWGSMAMDTPRYHFRSVRLDNWIYAVGDSQMKDRHEIFINNDMAKFNLDTPAPGPGEWVEMQTTFAATRRNFALVVFDKKIYAIGGEKMSVGNSPGKSRRSGGWILTSKCEEFDPESGVWTALTPWLEVERRSLVAVATDREIFAIGGEGKDPEEDTLEGTIGELLIHPEMAEQRREKLTTVEFWEPGATKWKRASSMNKGRSEGAAVYCKEQNAIFVFGGDSELEPTVEKFDLTRRTWAMVPQITLPRNSYCGTVAHRACD